MTISDEELQELLNKNSRKGKLNNSWTTLRTCGNCHRNDCEFRDGGYCSRWLGKWAAIANTVTASQPETAGQI